MLRLSLPYFSVAACLFALTTTVNSQPRTEKDIEKQIADLRARIDKLGQQPDKQLEREEAVFALILALREAPPLTRREENAILTRMLEETIETKGLQEKVKLKTALEYFSDKFGGRMPILINRSAFAAALGPDAQDPYEEEVSLPPVPAKMPMTLALRLVLAQFGSGQATFIVRQGYIEITTLKASRAIEYLYQPSVLLTFKSQLLPEVLEQLSDESGIAIHLDPKVGDKIKTPITAKFRNTTLEDALVVITEMAELKFVVLDRSIFVTTPERATILRKEEKERDIPRRDSKPTEIEQGNKRWESGS
jgi:hypothetical protein